MLFDTHAHYDAEAFDQDRDEVLAALPSRGVSLVVNPGCDIPSSQMAVDLAGRYDFLYAAVGYHPENCGPYCPADLDSLRQLAKAPKTAAIGEIGLDYYWAENPPREHQRQVFRDQMALAEELNLTPPHRSGRGCQTAYCITSQTMTAAMARPRKTQGALDFFFFCASFFGE